MKFDPFWNPFRNNGLETNIKVTKKGNDCRLTLVLN